MQLIAKKERILGNIPEQILHRSHKRNQIITFIKDSKSHASCECFTLILHKIGKVPSSVLVCSELHICLTSFIKA